MTHSLPFWTLDVFAERRFAGNPLAVVGEAGALTTAAMQAVAAEFNLSETVFVTRLDEAAGRATIRIFTPRRELPFAGHPTIGTAILLASQGLGRVSEGRRRLVLDELAGPVPVEVAEGGAGAGHATFVVPGTASVGAPLDPALVAPVLGLDPADLAGLAPRRAGHGVDFLMVELAGLAALGRARLGAVAMWPAALRSAGLENGVYLFTRATDDGSIRARMFAPFFGIPEDPATGAAAAALAGLLATTALPADLDGSWRIVQGVEMGRPSTIDVTATRRAGRLEQVTVAGSAVPVSEGRLYAGD